MACSDDSQWMARNARSAAFNYPKLFIFGLSLLFTLTLIFPAC